MLTRGKAKKLTVYLSETDVRHGRPLYQAIVELARKHGLAGATVSRGVMGYGAAGEIRSASLADFAGHLPLKVEIVDSAEGIDHLLPEVSEMVEEGMVELSDVEVVQVKPRAPRPPGGGGPHAKLAGKAKMLWIHIGAGDEWEGEPLHEALTKRFHLMDLAGVTVYRGLLGYGASGRVHRRKVWRSAGEPITLLVVDTPEKIATAMPVLDEMVQNGMVAISDAEVVLYRDGTPAPAAP